MNLHLAIWPGLCINMKRYQNKMQVILELLFRRAINFCIYKIYQQYEYHIAGPLPRIKHKNRMNAYCYAFMMHALMCYICSISLDQDWVRIFKAWLKGKRHHKQIQISKIFFHKDFELINVQKNYEEITNTNTQIQDEPNFH